MLGRVEGVTDLVPQVEYQSSGVVAGRLGRQHSAKTPHFTIENVHLDTLKFVTGLHLGFRRGVGTESIGLRTRRREERVKDGQERFEECVESLVPGTKQDSEWSEPNKHERWAYHNWRSAALGGAGFAASVAPCLRIVPRARSDVIKASPG